MERLVRLLTARTGLEWGLCVSGPFLLLYGLLTGKTVDLGKHSGLYASVDAHPLWYCAAMLFHAVCCFGLFVSVRKKIRNRGRWFPER